MFFKQGILVTKTEQDDEEGIKYKTPCYPLYSSRKAAMACKACGSANETRFGAEVNIYLPGPISLDEPGFLVFPKLAICLDCGFTQFTLPEGELRLLEKVLAGRGQAHIGTDTDVA